MRGVYDGPPICWGALASTGLAVAELAKVSFNSLLQEMRLLVVSADDQHGVVARDGANDLGPVFVVDASGDGLRASGSGDEDEQIECLANLESEALQHLADS